MGLFSAYDWFTAGAMYFTHTAPSFICLSRTIKKKKEMLNTAPHSYNYIFPLECVKVHPLPQK